MTGGEASQSPSGQAIGGLWMTAPKERSARTLLEKADEDGIAKKNRPEGRFHAVYERDFRRFYQLQGASPLSWRSDLKMVSGTSSPW